LTIDTAEGIPLMTAVSQHSRVRLAYDLLPQLRQASGLRRVVSVLAATKEGKLHADDLHLRKVSLLDVRGHASAAMTLSLEALARQAPEVSFIHNFPGSVRTSLIRADSGLLLRTVGFLSARIPFSRHMSHDECAARHEFLCVSARYPPRAGGDGDAKGAAVPVHGDMDVAVGADGQKGSGVYSVDELGEAASGQVVTLLAKYRGEGMLDKIWEHFRGEFVRITGAMDI
jgi:hypothetical protein